MSYIYHLGQYMMDHCITKGDSCLERGQVIIEETHSAYCHSPCIPSRELYSGLN